MVKIFYALKNNYGKIAFILSLIISYFLIPKTVFYGWYYLIAILFMMTFSLTMTCIIRNIREKIIANKQCKGSFLGLLASIIGISAFQVCTIGAPVCGISLGLGIVSFLFPNILLATMEKYAIFIIFISIGLQLLALCLMKCFKSRL